jgi:hypothetical protein
MTRNINGQMKGFKSSGEYSVMGNKERGMFNGIDYHQSLLAINKVMKKYCNKLEAIFVELNTNKFNRNHFYDYLHLNPKGNKELAGQLYNKLVKASVTDDY